MTTLGLTKYKNVDDIEFLDKMKNLIYLNDDVRPVWIGPGFASTNENDYKGFADWANKHWGLYYGFVKNDNAENDKLILDLGCGVGFCSINLTEFYSNATVEAYDIDEDIINFAKESNLHGKVIYKTENIITCNFPENVDKIFLIETLEHIKHMHHFSLIDKCLNSLKDENSRLYISTPNEQTFAYTERGHVGIITKYHLPKFINKYKHHIVSVSYYDNEKLSTCEPEDYTFDNNQLSHYKIIMRK
jgi:2-polyprenyl-3-methyl-5-hydroxy-6-metoxy-1,4-benzoquinol methylase